MKIERVRAARQIKRKLIEKHQVEWYEIEEAMLQPGLELQLAEKEVNGERRYWAESRTEAGRKLFIVCSVKANIAYIITAYQT